MIDLPSKKYVLEKYQNCTSQVTKSCCDGKRYHYCFTNYRAIQLQQKHVLEIKEKLRDLTSENSSNDTHYQILLIISGTELIHVLTGSLKPKNLVSDFKRFMAEFTMLKDYRNKICHSHEISLDGVKLQYHRLLVLCDMLGIQKMNNIRPTSV